jgi:hypothetical protein
VVLSKQDTNYSPRPCFPYCSLATPIFNIPATLYLVFTLGFQIFEVDLQIENSNIETRIDLAKISYCSYKFFSTNKIDHQEKTEILKVAFNIYTHPPKQKQQSF